MWYVWMYGLQEMINDGQLGSKIQSIYLSCVDSITYLNKGPFLPDKNQNQIINM